MLLVTKEIFFGETKVVGMVGERGWTNSLLDVASKPSTCLVIYPTSRAGPAKISIFGYCLLILFQKPQIL